MTSNNLLQCHYDKKQRVLNIIDTAREYEWISENQANEIKNRIEQNVLTIGVIGQMKSGKSTFLNTFVFGDDVLPSATTPMTAALSIITYGEEMHIEAEFYSQEEWEEQKALAQSQYEDSQEHSLRAAKIKAARELIGSNQFSEAELQKLLGTTQKDNMNQLIEYVGAKGKYVAITKAVKIYYPLEYLKGVEIVDTPGFNDPIVSREERAKEFLKKADVVLLLLYAGRPFDEADHNILFENVSESGIGKLIIGINKYDIAYQSGETIDQISEYVVDQVKKAANKADDPVLKAIIDEVVPIPISASMALLSQMNMSKIQSSGEYKHAWERLTDIFEISTQPEMRQKSLIDQLFSSVATVISEEKEEIMLRKPLNQIIAIGEKQRSDLKNSIYKNTRMIEDLNTPDEDLEDQLRNLEKLTKRLSKKIESLEYDIITKNRSILSSGKRECEDILDKLGHDIEKKLSSTKRTASLNDVSASIGSLIDVTVERTLCRKIEDLIEETKYDVIQVCETFIDESKSEFKRYLDDFENEQILNHLKNKLNLSADIKGSITDISLDEEKENKILTWLRTIILLPSEILFDNKVGQVLLGIDHFKANIRSFWTEVNVKLNQKLDDLFDLINKEHSSIRLIIEEALFTEILNPLKQQIEDIQNGKINKQKALAEAQEIIDKNTLELNILEQQITSVKNLI